MAPAPSPRGRAIRQSQGRLPAQEKPSRARAVARVLAAVMIPGPKRAISRALIRLEATVPAEISTVTKLASATCAPSAGPMAGQAVPNRESGMPRPMKAM